MPALDARPLAGTGTIARRLTLALACAAAVLLTSATAALGAQPTRLETQITDEVGALDGSIDEVQAALDALRDDANVQLFVLFVGTTQDLTVTEFADETAELSSLGGNDALLVVALDDRSDAIWVSDGLSISDEDLDSILFDTLEPRLADGDFPDAVIATAEALGATVSGPTPATIPPGPIETLPGGGPVTPGEPDRGLDVGLVLGLLLVAGGIVALVMFGASRVGAWREAEERDRRTGRLAREVNAALVTTDERIRAADQEAGFVEAEFGPEEAAPFRAAVAQARAELKEAFANRQRLDDAEPESPSAREQLLQTIGEGTGRANAALDAEAKRIEDLRSLERDAARILEALPAQLAAIESRFAAADRALSSLARFAPSASEAVRGNVTEAHKGVDGARAAIERARAAMTAGRSGVVREIVTAQRGIGGAAGLLDAIDVLSTAAAAAETALPGQLASAERDADAAESAIAGDPTGPEPGRREALAGVERAIRTARAAAAARPLDPLEAGRLASEAQTAAATLLSDLRRDAEQEARFAAALGSALGAAEAEIGRADVFIATRGGGVRRQARTRLAEAQRLFEQANASISADPKAALELANRADRLAGEAYSLAAMDFARWDAGRAGPSPNGADVAGAILGGIIGGILSGGGGGAGWGGSSWGSPGGRSSGPFGGGGGGWGGGGWGGGGGRSAGGGFGGFGGGGGGSGGGRSRGGRW